jgi:hypothetical protein
MLYGLDGWEYLEDSLDSAQEVAALERTGDPDAYPYKILEYARKKCGNPGRLAALALECVLDALDADLGDPDGEFIAPITDAMAQAIETATGKRCSCRVETDPGQGKYDKVYVLERED